MKGKKGAMKKEKKVIMKKGKKVTGGNTNESNYSLGLLIIFLIGFWIICNCINSSNCQSYSTEPMTPDTNSGMHYGNSPVVINGNDGLSYIRNTGGAINVPNSNTTMRHLYEENAYKCEPLENNSDIDDKQLTMHLDKQTDEGFRGPRSKTDSRELMCGSGHGRNIDDNQLTMHLNKRPDEGFRGPRSKTDSRELTCGS